MKNRFFTAIFLLTLATTFVATAQTVEEVNDRVNGIDENVATLLTDVSGLKKLKLSGYIQFNYENSEKAFGVSPYDATDTINQRFRMRRTRLKATYNAGLTQYVLQADFSNAGFGLKDAYMKITDPWTKQFSLQAGVFNRPNYEVEYSSSVRESMERSSVIKACYADERDLGAMLIYSPKDLFTLQVAAFSNTFKGPYKQPQQISGDFPLYYMARITKELILGDVGLDLGIHARIGSFGANSTQVIESDQPTKTTTFTTAAIGDPMSRTWFGGEFQLYYDFLGGMKLFGEYIMGSDINELSTTGGPIRQRDFNGYYIYLVKNIGSQWQFAAKYDAYDPNTAIADADIDNKSDLAVSTLGIGLHNYTFDKVRISLWYDVNSTQTHDVVMTEDPADNLFTLRLQYKF